MKRKHSILKNVIFLFIAILSACSNPAAPKENVVKTDDSHKKAKAAAPKSEPSYWKVNSFTAKEGETEGRKYVKFATEGNFSDSIETNRYLYAEVYVDKKNAGIFLHKLKKSSPAEKFNDPVQIKMTSSSGSEIQMTSSRRWNSSGGILIENNNNDYSQLRIFLLQNTGTVMVDVEDSQANKYHFSMFLNGFSDSFSKL